MRTPLQFGATPKDGGTRFRLWAPAEVPIELLLPDRSERKRLDPAKSGIRELSADVAVGEAYAFELEGGLNVPDPASRRQRDDVHGPSLVVDSSAYSWRHPEWRGRPWHETVLYELHVGTFTGEGTFEALRQKLAYLADLGVTAVELMPVGDFSGRRGWGYDGVLIYAPDATYGTPEDLMRLVDEAHGHGLMVFLDVVYNHFGPDGNYLHLYAPDFFRRDKMTPWGPAIDFRKPEVRRFVIENALHWLDAYRIDGLRLDAVHAIVDDTEPHLLVELAQEVRNRLGYERHVHLVLENEENSAHYLRRDSLGRPRHYSAQWNDDFHHVVHVALTGEREGYYEGYGRDLKAELARTLNEGFVYQGELMPYRGAARGEPSAELPPLAFVNFIQNHDQIGNRAMGDRLTKLAEPAAVQAAQALLLLIPSVPMLFMGEEWGAKTPFLFFCDFHDELADIVRNGRREEFAGFAAFADPQSRERIPDPNAASTFKASKLDWNDLENTLHKDWLARTKALLKLRQTEIAPRLGNIEGRNGTTVALGERAAVAAWRLSDGSRLTLLLNLGGATVGGVARPAGRLLFTTSDDLMDELAAGRLPAYAVACFLDDTG